MLSSGIASLYLSIDKLAVLLLADYKPPYILLRVIFRSYFIYLFFAVD